LSSPTPSSPTPPAPATKKEWPCTVVGLRGLAGAGKTTIQKHLYITAASRRTHVNGSAPFISKYSMAQPIRECLAVIGVSKETHPEMYRKGAQWIGTELCRTEDPDWWIKRAKEHLKLTIVDDVVVIDDIRFPNEADLCDLVFYIEPEFPPLDLGNHGQHASEQWNLSKEGRIDATIKNVHHKPSDAVDAILSHISTYLESKVHGGNPSTKSG